MSVQIYLFQKEFVNSCSLQSIFNVLKGYHNVNCAHDCVGKNDDNNTACGAAVYTKETFKRGHNQKILKDTVRTVCRIRYIGYLYPRLGSTRLSAQNVVPV